MTGFETGFVYFFIILGVFEVISNAYHLTRGSKERIGNSAKKQHGELPKNLSAEHYVAKAIAQDWGWPLPGLSSKRTKGWLPPPAKGLIAAQPLPLPCPYRVIRHNQPPMSSTSQNSPDLTCLFRKNHI